MNSPILQKQKVEVKAEGEMVVLKIGNSEMKMPYEAAIQIGLWLQYQGRQAKRFAGDTSRKWIVLADISAAEHGERPW